MEKYRKYKDSGVEWIGEIPSSWYINKVGNNTYVKGRIGWKGLRSEDFKDEGPFLITGTDFKQDGTINWDNMYHVDQWRYDEDPFIQLRDNDVLITKDGTIGKVVFVGNLKGQTCLNSGIFLTRPTNDEYLSRFFFWVLKSKIFEVFVDYNSGGSTIKHLYQNVFINFKYPIPPLSEQQQIVSYLDNKTQLIDSLLEQTKRKFELLKEQRTAIINEAVTKGLNPNVKMKDSGVEWIGEIPSHWDIVKVKYLGNVRSGDGLESNLIEDKGNYPVYGGNGVLGYYSDFNYSTNVLSIGRVGEKCGNVHFINNKVWINDNSLVLEPNSKVESLWYIFHSLTQRDLNQLRNKNTQPLITGTLVKNEYIPFPPKSEQQQIVEYLDKQTQKIDKTISIEEKRIKLLKEYRQSLISEVVTGKRKVTKDE